MLAEIANILGWLLLDRLIGKGMSSKRFTERVKKLQSGKLPSRILGRALGSGFARTAIPMIGATAGMTLLYSLLSGGGEEERQTPEQAMLAAMMQQAQARQSGNNMQDLLETLMLLKQLQGQQQETSGFYPQYLLPPTLGTTGQAIGANIPYRV